MKEAKRRVKLEDLKDGRRKGSREVRRGGLQGRGAEVLVKGLVTGGEREDLVEGLRKRVSGLQRTWL